MCPFSNYVLTQIFFILFIFFLRSSLFSAIIYSIMEKTFKYRGKTYTKEEISFVRQFVFDNPNDSRYALSKKLCQIWGWKQKNGALRDMVCRSFMLELERAG